jgi:hypothetical protein
MASEALSRDSQFSLSGSRARGLLRDAARFDGRDLCGGGNGHTGSADRRATALSEMLAP